MHVESDLFAMVFGESVLNDAVAIVLSRSCAASGTATSDLAASVPTSTPIPSPASTPASISALTPTSTLASTPVTT
ncbi:unnamed protein product [Gongylonema pulchrum]|uniref:Na_H_Exchanger domain-containing protein n=1 Tax=Gongylonema pulchrum TaxID=637853 RepID=A0A183EP01_9BILA|nr:unnamed protein product [Gongylonema pulchrum]